MTEPAPRRTVRPFDTERLLRALDRLQAQRTFADPEDLQRFLDAWKGRPLDEVRQEAGGDARDEAQELAFQALEAASPAEARELAAKALALDPDNVDARHAAALHRGQGPEETADRLKVVAVEAEQALGGDFIQAEKGRLWGHLHARPYLRARMALAVLLERSGKPKEALPHFEALLRFSQGDPQGVRLHLARCLAVLGRFQALGPLLDAFPEEEGTAWMWLRVLERQHAGTEREAEVALNRARSRNPHVEAFLTARAKPPRELPPEPPPGSPEEAALALRTLGPAWSPHREALTWLMRQG